MRRVRHSFLMSHSENKAFNTISFDMMTRHFLDFVHSFYSKSDHFTANLGTNMIEHVSEMGLYIIHQL